jgi:replicative DNA helicase
LTDTLQRPPSTNGTNGAGDRDSLSWPRMVRLGDLAEEWEADAAAAHEARITGRPRGPVSGLPGLDEKIGGSFAPGVHIVHGSAGAGKTAFCLQVAASALCPALYVTVEMGRLELARRITARLTGTYLGRLKSGEMRPQDSLKLFAEACAAAPLVTLADVTEGLPREPERSILWFYQAAEVTRAGGDHLLVVVDSLHSWAEALAPEAPEYEALNYALAHLRMVSKRYACAVLVAAERNRASMNRGGLSAGAGSRKIEYGAETVLDLKREPDARTDAAGEVEIRLQLAKNRSGSPGGDVGLLFHGALQRFREA